MHENSHNIYSGFTVTLSIGSKCLFFEITSFKNVENFVIKYIEGKYCILTFEFIDNLSIYLAVTKVYTLQLL